MCHCDPSFGLSSLVACHCNEQCMSTDTYFAYMLNFQSDNAGHIVQLAVLSTADE